MAQQPTQVLPSNAPPLRDSHVDHTLQRTALQEHSGNRQQIYHHHHAHHHPHPHSLNIYEPHKLASNNIHTTALGENAYAVRQSTARPSYYGQQQGYYPQRHSWPRGFQDRDADARARVEHGWESLYHRFVNCPKYKDYRSRQHKDGKNVSDQKWPEQLEKAFFKALLYWPPMGRRKLMHKEKQRGRNELIADYIEALTRVKRTRKQVSSHIQVLKPLVEQDERIMAWLSEKDHGENQGRHHGSYNSSYTSGRLRSTYSASAQHMQMGSAPLPQASEVRQARVHLDVFQPAEFKLFVQPSVRRNADDIDPLHMYSQSAASPLTPDQHISSWSALQREMPVLAERHARRPIQCNVLAVEASLSMPSAPWLDRENIELAVILNCVSRRLTTARRVHCVNSFYKNGELVPQNDPHGSNELQLTRLDAGDGSDPKCETRLKFGSSFWAGTLNPGSNLAKSIMSSVQRDASECARLRKNVDAEMRSITAIQEISIPTQGDILEPVLVMHWSFSLSNTEVGSTTWHRLHLPLTTSQAIKAELPGLAVDTPFDFNAPVETVACGAAAQTGYAAPALQSPFEYDNGSASAQSPTTWATSVSAASSTHNTQHSVPNSATELLSAESSFELSHGSMMMFDPTVLDSSAFNFDVHGVSTADCDFATSGAATADQVGDEQALAYTVATQGWGAPGYAETYSATDWQDFGTATAANGVNVGAYAGYNNNNNNNNNHSGNTSAEYAYANGFEGAQSFAGGVVGSNAIVDDRQAYAGAVQSVSRTGHRDWQSSGYDAMAGSR